MQVAHSPSVSFRAWTFAEATPLSDSGEGSRAGARPARLALSCRAAVCLRSGLDLDLDLRHG